MTFVVPGLTYFDLIVRVLAAFLAGIIVGVERESHGRAAGMRTTILVCVAACLAMLLSAALSANLVEVSNTMARPDPARLAAGVLSGMGFLGAGSILRNGNRVQGLTTAATLWFVTMIGLVFGAGYLLLGAIGVFIMGLVLFVLPPIERLVKNDWYATVTICARLNALSDDAIRQMMEAQGVRVKGMELDYDLAQQMKTVRCEVKFKRDDGFGLSSKVMQTLILQESIVSASWR